MLPALRHALPVSSCRSNVSAPPGMYSLHNRQFFSLFSAVSFWLGSFLKVLLPHDSWCALAAAEIGDATVGSLASSTSKDSSLGAPGYFSALVASLTFVDERGEARPDPVPFCRSKKILLFCEARVVCHGRGV